MSRTAASVGPAIRSVGPRVDGSGLHLVVAEGTAEAAHAAWLFQLNYQRLRGRPEAELVAEIKAVHARQ